LIAQLEHPRFVGEMIEDELQRNLRRLGFEKRLLLDDIEPEHRREQVRELNRIRRLRKYLIDIDIRLRPSQLDYFSCGIQHSPVQRFDLIAATNWRRQRL